MSVNSEKFLAIELETQGRNTIPYIVPESIITIHGKNGVGKSMAATLLEIASGNYIFENEERFNKLKNVIDSCEIKFMDDKDLIYKVELKPHLWNFDSNLNIVNPLTIGNFFKAKKAKLKEIRFNDFQKEVYIRTIRGNESLAQQIYFFKDIFVAKITQKLEKLEKKIAFLEEYKEWFYEKAEEKTIREYANFQIDYNDKLDKINNLKSSINNRKSDINKRKKQLDLLENLLYINKNDEKTLKEQKESKEKIVKKIQDEIDSNYKKLSEIENKLEALQKSFCFIIKFILKSF
jgi:hypothetical protein